MTKHICFIKMDVVHALQAIQIPIVESLKLFLSACKLLYQYLKQGIIIDKWVARKLQA